MGKPNLMSELDPVALPVPQRRRGPFTHSVDRYNRGLLKGGGKESTGRVRLVMLREQHRPPVTGTQLTADDARYICLVAKPCRYGSEKGAQPSRRDRQIGLHEALSFQQR